MQNAEVKREMKSQGVKQWEVAQHLGISEATICRRMRSELEPDFKKTVINAIHEIGSNRSTDVSR